MAVRIVEKMGDWNALMRLAHAGKPHTKVGFLEDGKGTEKHGKSALTNAEIAVVHEYGAPSVGVPERSFLRASLERNRPETTALTKKLVTGIFLRKLTVERALNVLGAQVAANAKQEIRMGLQPPVTEARAIAKMGKTRAANHQVDIALAAEAHEEAHAQDAYTPARETKRAGRQTSTRGTRAAAGRLERAIGRYQGAIAKDKPLIHTGQLINSITWTVISAVPA